MNMYEEEKSSWEMLGKWEDKRRTLPTLESQPGIELETNGLLEQRSLLSVCLHLYMCACTTTSFGWRPGSKHGAAMQRLSGSAAATFLKVERKHRK